MTEAELAAVVARAAEAGEDAEEYVANEIRAYLAKQPKASLFLRVELKVGRSIDAWRRVW